MNIHKTEFIGVFVIELNPRMDERGLFMRVFCKEELAECGLSKEIVQINQSVTSEKGTFRGFHYQLPPHSETKIVRCLHGRVADIIIDMRKGSDTFLKCFNIELTADNNTMLFIPDGIAHGFQTLSDNCHLQYLHTEFYTPKSEGGISYNDPRLNLTLPIPISNISQRDNNFPFLTNDFKGF